MQKRLGLVNQSNAEFRCKSIKKNAREATHAISLLLQFGQLTDDFVILILRLNCVFSFNWSCTHMQRDRPQFASINNKILPKSLPKIIRHRFGKALAFHHFEDRMLGCIGIIPR